tara:strand:+ start:2401 stop:2625 length:225 start_codon:yes stop_codon:yes gene_type:complete
MFTQPKLFFGLTATIATIYVYKNYDTMPSYGDIKLKVNSLCKENKIHLKNEDISNSKTDISNSDIIDMSNNDHV